MTGILLEHSKLAHELSQQRGEHADELRDWLDAERKLIQQKAYELSLKRRRTRAPAADWVEAERLVRWQEWCERLRLPPYLAIQSGSDPAGVAEFIKQNESEDRQTETAARCAILLDGAPEYSQTKYELHRANCVDPRKVIEAKDGKFLAHARAAVRVYSGESVPREPRTAGASPVRIFQDAYLATICGTDGPRDAIACGVRLRQALTQYNHQKAADWTEELHCRMIIAQSWDAVTRAIPLVQRDEIAVEGTLVRILHPDLQHLLVADGLRVIGPVGPRVREPVGRVCST